MNQDPFAAFGGQAIDPPSVDPFAAFGGQATALAPRRKQWSDMTPQEQAQLRSKRGAIATQQFNANQPDLFGGYVSEMRQNVNPLNPNAAMNQPLIPPKVFSSLGNPTALVKGQTTAPTSDNPVPGMLSGMTTALSIGEQIVGNKALGNLIEALPSSAALLKFAAKVRGGSIEEALKDTPGISAMASRALSKYGRAPVARILEETAKRMSQTEESYRLLDKLAGQKENVPPVEPPDYGQPFPGQTAQPVGTVPRPTPPQVNPPTEADLRRVDALMERAENRPPISSDPTQYGQFPGQTAQPVGTVPRPIPGIVPQTESTNPVIAITQKLSPGKLPSKNLVQAASRLIQSDPYIANLSPESLSEELLSRYKAAGEAIKSAQASVPADTTVDMVKAKLAWVQQAQQAQESGLTASANKLMSMVKSTPDKMSWNQFLSVKDSLKNAAFGGRSRNFALSQAYGELIDASRGISSALDTANAQSSLFRSVLDAAKIHPETGIRYR